MAATKTDPLAAKQAKQKKILIVLSVVLVAIVAIQVPKLMGGGSSSAAPAPTTATDPAAATPAATTTGSTTYAAPTSAASQTAPTAITDSSATPKPGQAQLASFSLFETKDPFVQQLKDEEPGSSPATPPAAAGGKGAAAGGIATGGTGGAKPAPVKMTNATISVNGEAEALTLEQTFPADNPMFVLAGLKPKQARIGIAGGALKNGKTVPLALGKKLTLVDAATGARYTLELLYVGTAPEETAQFTAPSSDQAQPTP